MRGPIVSVLGAFGVTPAAAEAAIVDFVKSAWKSAGTVSTAFVTLAYTQGAFASPEALWVWVKTSWWAFLVAEFAVPIYRGGKKTAAAMRAGASSSSGK